MEHAFLSLFLTAPVQKEIPSFILIGYFAVNLKSKVNSLKNTKQKTNIINKFPKFFFFDSIYELDTFYIFD